MKGSIDTNKIIMNPTREQYFDLVDRLKNSPDNDLQKIRERLKKKYKSERIRFIYKLEKGWDDCADVRDFGKVYKMLEKTIRGKAEYYGRKWSNKRLSQHDFESVFWETAWHIVEEYDGTGQYYLYETVTEAFKKRAGDIIRKATKTKQGRLESEALSIKEQTERYVYATSLEKRITDKLVVDQLMPLVLPGNCDLIFAIKQNPDASNQEIADLIGFAHREKVRRKKEKIKKIISACPDIEKIFQQQSWFAQGCRKGRMSRATVVGENMDSSKILDPWDEIRKSRRNQKAG